MRCSTRLVSRLNTKRRFSLAFLLVTLGLTTGSVWAQMPDGPGREEVQKLCSDCHELARSVSLRQDRDGWKTTINKMISLGAQGMEQEFAAALDYLSSQYPAEAMPRLNVNKAKAIDIESRLSLRRSQSAAVIEYRAKHGDFKSIEDLKKVPGIDPAKIDAKKDILEF
jgi:competence protein ComEA